MKYIFYRKDVAFHLRLSRIKLRQLQIIGITGEEREKICVFYF